MLESENLPCVHKAARILLYLIFANNTDVDSGENAVRLAARRATVVAMKSKIISFLDDPNFMMELAIAQFLDPRTKSLRTWAHIWGDTFHTKLFLSMRAEFKTFVEFVKAVHTNVLSYLADIAACQ